MSTYKEVEIQWLQDGKSRIWNFNQIEFCWANKKLQQLFTFTACKDHLQDVIHSHFKGQSTIPMNYYVPGVNPTPSFDKTRLLVADTSKGDDFSTTIPKMVDLLNLAEKKLKICKTKAFKVSNPLQPHMKSGVFLLESSGRWTISPPMISLYSLLIRISPGHKIGETLKESVEGLCRDKDRVRLGVFPRDQYYLKIGKWAIDRIFKYSNKIWYNNRKENFPTSVGYYTMHGLGLCGMSSDKKHINQKELVPRWYRDIDVDLSKETANAKGS